MRIIASLIALSAIACAPEAGTEDAEPHEVERYCDCESPDFETVQGQGPGVVLPSAGAYLSEPIVRAGDACSDIAAQRPAELSEVSLWDEKVVVVGGSAEPGCAFDGDGLAECSRYHAPVFELIPNAEISLEVHDRTYFSKSSASFSSLSLVELSCKGSACENVAVEYGVSLPCVAEIAERWVR